MLLRTCKGIKKNGAGCPLPPVKGSEYCRHHQPGKQGGRADGRPILQGESTGPIDLHELVTVDKDGKVTGMGYTPPEAAREDIEAGRIPEFFQPVTFNIRMTFAEWEAFGQEYGLQDGGEITVHTCRIDTLRLLIRDEQNPDNTRFKVDIPACFSPDHEAPRVATFLNGKLMILTLAGLGEHTPEEWHGLFQQLHDRNAWLGIEPLFPIAPPAAPEGGREGMPEAKTADAWNVYTSQEIDAWETAAADGKTGSHWHFDQQTGEARHARPKANHSVVVHDRHELDPVDTVIRRQDANTGLAAMYVLSMLDIKDSLLPENMTYTVVVDLLDVAKKSGMITRQGKSEREKARARVWGMLQFGARAEVTGERSTPYIDHETGKTIPTRISGKTLWALQNIEEPDERAIDPQLRLYPLDTVPLRVRVTLNKEWEPLILGQLKQYIKFGERIGSIPAGQPSGAWAQVMSLFYLRWARMNPHSALRGGAPTRRDMLTTYPPAVGNLEEVAGFGNNPRRIVEIYRVALGIMADKGIIERSGDADESVDDQLRPYPRKGWLDDWLDTSADIIPGADIRQSLTLDVAAKLPPPRPRELNPARKKKRPRKPTAKGDG